MLRSYVLALLMIGLTGPNASNVHAQTAENHSILLFGARWCAPCMAEYRDLPNLARAASPDQITLAWIDRSIAAPADLKSEVRSIRAEEALRIADQVAGVGYGLPFTAMFDANGHVCSIWRHPLAPADVGHLRASCRSVAKASR